MSRDSVILQLSRLVGFCFKELKHGMLFLNKNSLQRSCVPGVIGTCYVFDVFESLESSCQSLFGTRYDKPVGESAYRSKRSLGLSASQ